MTNKTYLTYCFLIFFAALGALFFVPKTAQAAMIQRPPSSLGLVGYWSFNEGSGPTAYDQSGQGNKGVLTGGPTWTTGKLGKALSFDGSDDFVSIAANSSLAPGTAITISLWVNPRSLPSSGQVKGLVNKGSVNEYVFELWNDSGTQKIVWYPSAYALIATYTLPTNTWSHLVITHTSAYLANIYLNGQSIASGSLHALANLGNSLTIGERGGGTTYFNGLIDDVRIYNRALSQAEVTALYNSGAAKILAAPKNGLVGYWSFNEGTGPTAYDQSGNGNKGVLTNGPTWTNGKLGKALKFDGVDDYVNAGDINAIDTATQLTGCAWVKHNSISSDDAIMAKIDSSNNDGFSFFRDDSGLNSSRADIYKIYFADSADTDAASIEGATNSSRLNIWTHVCFTFQAAIANGLHLYINGVEDANSPVSTASVGAINAGANVFSIGIASISSYPFDGLIDDVRVYNRTLSASEITALYNSGAAKILAAPKNGLVGYWSFNEGTGPTAYDQSGQGNKGVINGASWANGKLGKALSFDGTDDYVTSNSNIDLTTAFTFSTWMNVPTTTYYWQGVFNYGVTTGYGGNIQIFYSYGNAIGKGIVFVDLNAGGKTLNTDYILSNFFNNYHHLVVSYDSSLASNNLKIYFDNALKAQGDYQTSITDTNKNIYIGYVRWNWYNLYHSGSLDDVRVYNRALSASEVLQLYNSR